MTNSQTSERIITLELVRIDVGWEDVICLGFIATDADGGWIVERHLTPTRDELVQLLREQDETFCSLLAKAKRLADTKRQERGWLDDPLLIEVERFYREPDEALYLDFHDYHPEHYCRKQWLSLPLDPRFVTVSPPCRRE